MKLLHLLLYQKKKALDLYLQDPMTNHPHLSQKKKKKLKMMFLQDLMLLQIKPLVDKIYK